MTADRDERGEDARRRTTVRAGGGIAGVTVDASHPLRPLKEGQARCPHCEQPHKVNAAGRIQAHGTCPSSAGHTGPVHLEDLPPVVTRGADPNRESIISAVEGRPAIEVGSLCQHCGKWLPGERRLCSKGAREREENRR